jgi:hypothetical protein
VEESRMKNKMQGVVFDNKEKPIFFLDENLCLGIMVLLVENSSRLSRSVEEKRRMGIKRERERERVEECGN